MEKKSRIFDKVKGELIVSCQALPDETLHSSYIMKKMAYSAMVGGAKGIRANSVADIRAIKEVVDLPIIGIIKQVYIDSDVVITPTLTEVDALYDEGVDIIAMDATNRIRPNNVRINDLFLVIKEKYPEQIFMADCSTYEEGLQAYEMGFDCIGTTLNGYTSYTKNNLVPDLQLIRKLVDNIQIPIIAEGGIWTPEELKNIFDLGVHTAVVGTAITRPTDITKRFVAAIK